jgi:galactose-1-phosphate uridylyltransferase
MKFETIKKQTLMTVPQKGPELQRVNSEIRIDPLTRRTSRICHFMPLSWKKPDLAALVAKGGDWCPFCDPNVHQVTPRFAEDLVAEGRMQKGDMIIFPNLAPYDSISAVARFGTHRHYIPMTDFTPSLIAEAFALCLEFFRRVVAAKHPEAVFHIINWNSMPPSGSSVIHPHLQVFSTSTAPDLMRQELDAAKTYFAQHGTSYWDDLVAAEKADGRRYLAKIGRSHWMTAFAPLGTAGDVMAVVENVRSTLELAPADLADLAAGLACAMTAYDKMGLYSFNMNFSTSTADDDTFRFHLLFSPRTYFNAVLGTPDTGALRNLYNESICMAFPEEINAMLKPDFDAGG